MTPSRLTLAGIAVFAIALIAGCSTTSSPNPTSTGTKISGTVTFSDSITIPASARLHVTLLDASSPGSQPIASSESKISGNPPFAFALPVDPVAIASAGRPLLFAQIIVAGRPWFSNALTPYVVTPASIDGVQEIVLRNDMRSL